MPAVDVVVDEAVGRGHRADPVVPRSGGPAGNARLTSWIGLLLLAVSLAELVTLLDVTGLIGWHVALGIVLTSLALAKTASTGWRIMRYYTGSQAYGSAGPPPLILRFLGPLVVLSTLCVLGSGIALIALGRPASERSWFSLLGQGISPLTLHQLSFILFGVFVGLHVLARLVPAVLQASGRVRVGEQRATVPGGAARALIVALCLVAGVIALIAVLPVSGWRHDHFGVHHGAPFGR